MGKGRVRGRVREGVGPDFVLKYTFYGDLIYVFSEMKLRSLVSNFHIHVSVSHRSGNFVVVHKFRNWEQGHPVSFLGIFISNFRRSVGNPVPELTLTPVQS
jgi:hypothetical protein